MSDINIQSASDKEIYVLINGKSRKTIIGLLGITLLGLIVLFIILAVKIKSFGLLLGAVLVPIILFIFLLKLFIWHLFGLEKITLKKHQIKVEYHYSYIYKTWSQEIKGQKPKFLYRTMEDGTIPYSKLKGIDDSKRVKFQISGQDDVTYTSSFSLLKKDVPDLAALYKKLK